MILETVKIDRPEHRLGYVIINKSDFDPKSMRLYEDKQVDRSADRFQSQHHEISGFTTGTESPAIPGVTGLPKRGRPAKVKE